MTREEFERRYWGDGAGTVPFSTRREFYSDYRESGMSFRAYKLATSLPIEEYYAVRGRRNPRPRLTKEQRSALNAYNFALSQEDRYLGSVFVTPAGQRRVEANTAAAYEQCKRLGMTHEHGL